MVRSHTGEYCESSRKPNKKVLEAVKKYNKEWWISLPDAQKALITYFKTDPKCVSKGLFVAHMREITLNEAYKKITGIIQTPKKLEKYQYLYDHMDQLKEYINQL